MCRNAKTRGKCLCAPAFAGGVANSRHVQTDRFGLLLTETLFCFLPQTGRGRKTLRRFLGFLKFNCMGCLIATPLHRRAGASGTLLRQTGAPADLNCVRVYRSVLARRRLSALVTLLLQLSVPAKFNCVGVFPSAPAQRRLSATATLLRQTGAPAVFILFAFNFQAVQQFFHDLTDWPHHLVSSSFVLAFAELKPSEEGTHVHGTITQIHGAENV